MIKLNNTKLLIKNNTIDRKNLKTNFLPIKDREITYINFIQVILSYLDYGFLVAMTTFTAIDITYKEAAMS